MLVPCHMQGDTQLLANGMFHACERAATLLRSSVSCNGVASPAPAPATLTLGSQKPYRAQSRLDCQGIPRIVASSFSFTLAAWRATPSLRRALPGSPPGWCPQTPRLHTRTNPVGEYGSLCGHYLCGRCAAVHKHAWFWQHFHGCAVAPNAARQLHTAARVGALREVGSAVTLVVCASGHLIPTRWRVHPRHPPVTGDRVAPPCAISSASTALFSYVCPSFAITGSMNTWNMMGHAMGLVIWLLARPSQGAARTHP